jgi:pimeloyl-ACP methyl ester carboxylesterase
MMKALTRRHTPHTVPLAARTIAITLAISLAVASARAPSASATTATTSISATAPGGVHLRAWVSEARPGAATLIVINGGPGNSHLAAPPAGQLAPRFRVVFYDQRGTGKSGTPRDDAFDVPHQVGDLEALRRRLGAPEVDLLGHSFGGLIAAAYAARYPQHVSRLVLAGALPADAIAIPQADVLIGRRLAALIAGGIIPTPLPPVVGNDCSAQTMAISVASLANPRSHRPTHLPPGTCNETTWTQTRAQITTAICDAVRTHLRRYGGHVLLLFGKQDPRLPVFQHLDQAELPAAHVQVKVLPHSGHDTWIENRQFFPTIRRFLLG